MNTQQKKSFNLGSNLFNNSTEFSSLPAEWREKTLENNDIPKGQLAEICLNPHVLGLNIGQPRNKELKDDGCCIPYPLLSDDAMAIPPGFAGQSHMDKGTSSLVLNFSDEILDGNTSERLEVDTSEVIPNALAHNPLMPPTNPALHRELALTPESSPICVETVANALAIHFRKQGSNRIPQNISKGGMLGGKRLKTVLKYINDHLSHTIRTLDLADLVQLSPSHFARAFKKATGLSPHQYVIQRRVEKAKQLLLHRTMTISDVALACGFTHQSHLNRHFKRLLNMTPTEFLNQ